MGDRAIIAKGVWVEVLFFFRIGEIMPFMRQGETWPEFSEFAIISNKIGENKGESL